MMDAEDHRLHAFIDGELPEDERARMVDALATDPALARRADLFRQDKERLLQVYGGVADRPIPRRWIEMIEAPAAAQPRRRVFSMETIAAMAAALLLLVGGPLVYRQMTPHEEPIVEEALAARDATVPAGSIAAIRQTSQTAAAGHAVSAALAMRVSAPDLSRMGYTLAGYRIYRDADGGKPAAELLYRHRDSRVFALYLRRPNGAPRFDQYKQGRLRVCIWQDDVLGAVMTGEMSAAEMQRLASLAYTGLES
jgi:anti-sigma factor RsiW